MGKYEERLVYGDLAGEDETEEKPEHCPNCGRKINKHVKKCSCGMEFD